jgi:hypothetical protein
VAAEVRALRWLLLLLLKVALLEAAAQWLLQRMLLLI